jgi:hypothetical protein
MPGCAPGAAEAAGSSGRPSRPEEEFVESMAMSISYVRGRALVLPLPQSGHFFTLQRRVLDECEAGH